MRRICLHAAIGLLMAVGTPVLTAPAVAQTIVARVNGEPISGYEVDQRMRINRLLRAPATSRSAALNELIDDKVKISEGRRIGFRVTDEYVEEQMQRIAKGNNQTMLEFHQNLGKLGVNVSAYREKLRAGYIWEAMLERRTKAGSPSSDPIFQDSGGSGRVIDYTLHSVIFVLPRGASAGGRMAEANGARSRFNSCTTGLAMLRGMRDVAVKSAVRRSSDSLSPQLNKILEATPVNRLTQPFASPQGIETIAVCEKTQRSGGRAGGANDDPKRKAADSQSYMRELRAKAVIQSR